MSKENGTSEFIFAVKVDDNLTCLVQADQAVLLDDGSVKFIVHNDHKTIVGLFKKYDYFLIERVNQ